MALEANPSSTAPPDATTVCCDVAAHGIVRATAAELPALRQKPGTGGRRAAAASFLKHADEQTVAGLAAVFQAIHRGGLAGTAFTDWGVVAAPRFSGVRRWRPPCSASPPKAPGASRRT